MKTTLSDEERLSQLINELSSICLGKTPTEDHIEEAKVFPAEKFLFYTGMLFSGNLSTLSTVARNTLAESVISDDHIHYKNCKKSIYSFIER